MYYNGNSANNNMGGNKLIGESAPKLHAIYPTYVIELQELQAEIAQRSFNFESSIYELQEMQLSLAAHPEHNILELNEIYARGQAYFDRVTTILISIQAELSFWKAFLQEARRILKKARMLLIEYDTKVTQQKNLSLQEAYIEAQVPEIIFLVHELEKTIMRLKDYADMALLRRDSLDKLITTQGKQQRVLESLINLGYTQFVGVK